ncbi:MAG: RlpA-like double-psi beta-barrel-protein domain-containing protein-containing protein, partial [Piptocephalis tieghemiana]
APAPAAAAPASAPAAGTYSGDATYYTPGLGACEATNTASDHIAALNSPQFGNWARYLNSPFCVNTCALVKGPKGQVKVKIVDRCPECKRGDLDLSPAAFDLIADAAKGRVEISWSWTSCDGVKA